MSGLTSQLRHRISIEQASQTADDAGGYSTSWNELAEVFAAIAPYGVQVEKDEHGALKSNQKLHITIRYREDVTTDMRVMFNGTYYNIKAVTDPEMRKHRLELLVEEGRAS